MENTLNAIKDMSLDNAHYMGKYDSYKKKLNKMLTSVSAKPTPAQLGRIKVYYQLIDLFGKKFAEGMGWI